VRAPKFTGAKRGEKTIKIELLTSKFANYSPLARAQRRCEDNLEPHASMRLLTLWPRLPRGKVLCIHFQWRDRKLSD